MKNKNLIKAILVSFVFLAMALSTKTGFCDANALVEEGKTLLLKNMDIYGADAKFAAALDPAQGGDPANQKANFWRAVTVIATNPDLKTMLINMGIIDTGNKIAFMDEAGQPKNIFSKVNDIIIDSDVGPAGYSEVGTWTPGTGGYGKDYRTHAATAGGSGAKAVWTPDITVTGDYHISMWWGYSASNSPDAEVTIYYEDDGGIQQTKTFTLNQLQNCDKWSKLSVCRLSPGKSHRVEISDKGTGAQVIADAVKFEYDATVMDDLSADVGFAGAWNSVSDSRARNGSYREIATGSGGTCVWTLNVPALGKYRLQLEYIGSATNASNAAYEIRVGGVLKDTVHINQQNTNDRRCNLGMYEFQAGTGNTITLSQNSGGKIGVDTLRIIPVRYDATLTEVQTVNVSALTQAG
ncbi:MAG: hypothetical protein V1752_00385, partial [Candidatus Firestonebacteria bacterium]